MIPVGEHGSAGVEREYENEVLTSTPPSRPLNPVIPVSCCWGISWSGAAVVMPGIMLAGP